MAIFIFVGAGGALHLHQPFCLTNKIAELKVTVLEQSGQKMAMTLRACFILLFVQSFFTGSDADEEVVFFAPGGCDDSDAHCVPAKAPASQEIHRYISIQHMKFRTSPPGCCAIFSFVWRNHNGGVESLQRLKLLTFF